MELIDGKTYARIDGAEETIGGTCKDYPAWVWTIGGNWYERATGKYISCTRFIDANGKENFRPVVVDTESRRLMREAAPLSIYAAMVAAGVKVDNHESDLYVPVNDTTQAILAQYPNTARPTVFTSQVDGQAWFDIPFAYAPFWTAKAGVAQAQYIVSACDDGRRIRSDVFEATAMSIALEDAKRAWPELAALSWLAERGEDHPAAVARLLSWLPYVVTYNARKRDAIGIFYPVVFNVKAPDEAAALQAAFTMAQSLGYETLHPISVTRKV